MSHHGIQSPPFPSLFLGRPRLGRANNRKKTKEREEKNCHLSDPRRFLLSKFLFFFPRKSNYNDLLFVSACARRRIHAEDFEMLWSKSVPQFFTAKVIGYYLAKDFTCF